MSILVKLLIATGGISAALIIFKLFFTNEDKEIVEKFKFDISDVDDLSLEIALSWFKEKQQSEILLGNKDIIAAAIKDDGIQDKLNASIPKNKDQIVILLCLFDKSDKKSHGVVRHKAYRCKMLEADFAKLFADKDMVIFQ